MGVRSAYCRTLQFYAVRTVGICSTEGIGIKKPSVEGYGFGFGFGSSTMGL